MRALSLTVVTALSLLTGCIADSADPAQDDGADENTGALVNTSSSWANGELAKASGRLLDYSYAGYHHGEAAIPTPAVTANVKSFGAVGDGVHDDTQAFIDAIAKTASGAILVPAGRYVITQRITIRKANLVLRGEGTGKTILEFPKSLAEVDGKDPSTFGGTSPYAFGPAYITILGNTGGPTLASVTAGAKRGSKKLTVSTAAGMSVGQWVKLTETDVGNTLAERLYGDHSEPGTDLTGAELVHFESRISAISGSTITLERALPIDVETRWTPQISAVGAGTEFGIEHLAIHFKGEVYPGHFKEHGYNALDFQGVADCWVQDVRITNTDFGVAVERSFSTTLDGLTFDTDFDRAKDTGLVGHHALWTKGGGDNLVTGFAVKAKFVHDLSIERTEFQTVYANGKGVDLNMDHHKDAPYGTLFTNLDVGAGSRPFQSGGGAGRGAQSGAFSTFWNIRSAAPFKLPPGTFGPYLNFVGVNTSTTSVPDSTWHLDGTTPVTPADLHEAERKDRVGR